MTQPHITILGAYRFEVSDADIREFLKLHLPPDTMTADMEAQFLLKRDELSSVVALDVLVTNADERFDIGGFRQPASDQVAYDEVYLSEDGRSIESSAAPRNRQRFRVYFFLHFFDKNKPLLTGYSELSIAELQPLPEYLRELHPFTPVD